MAIQTLNTIKNWFKTSLKPSQQQFWDTWDSFRHKFEKVPVKDVDGIDELLLSKADKTILDNHLADKNAHAPQVNTDWNSESGFSQLLNKPEFKTINGESLLGDGDLTIEEGGLQNLDQTLANGNSSTEYIKIIDDDDKSIKYGGTNIRGFNGTQETTLLLNNREAVGNVQYSFDPNKDSGDYTIVTKDQLDELTLDKVLVNGDTTEGMSAIFKPSLSPFGSKPEQAVINHTGFKLNKPNGSGQFVDARFDLNGIYGEWSDEAGDAEGSGGFSANAKGIALWDALTQAKTYIKPNRTYGDLNEYVLNLPEKNGTLLTTTDLDLQKTLDSGKTWTDLTDPDKPKFFTVSDTEFSGDVFAWQGSHGHFAVNGEESQESAFSFNGGLNVYSEPNPAARSIEFRANKPVTAGRLIFELPNDKPYTSVEKEINVGNYKLATTDDFKTINGESILGEGNLTVEGGSQNLQQVLDIGDSANIRTYNNVQLMDGPDLYRTTSFTIGENHDELGRLTINRNGVYLQNYAANDTTATIEAISGKIKLSEQSRNGNIRLELANPTEPNIVYTLPNKPQGNYTIATLNDITSNDSSLLHKTGDEIKNGQLTINATTSSALNTNGKGSNYGLFAYGESAAAIFAESNSSYGVSSRSTTGTALYANTVTGAKIASFAKNSSEKSYIDGTGNYVGGAALSGTPTAPTAAFGDSSTIIANTQFVRREFQTRLKAYTVSTLPTGARGDLAYVTDAISPVYLGTLTGGGSIICPVFYNGSTWVAH